MREKQIYIVISAKILTVFFFFLVLVSLDFGNKLYIIYNIVNRLAEF